MTTIYIYDEVEPGLAREVNNLLEKAGGADVTLRINSPGGDIFEGTAVSNAIRRYDGHVTAIVDGLAASAASVIAVSADELVMARNTSLMIHDAWVQTFGNADDLTSTISRLETESAAIARVYAEKAGGDERTWREAMKAETWFTAEEAIQAGLADRIEALPEAEKVVNTFNGSPIMASYRGRRNRPSETLLNPTSEKEENMSFKAIAESLGTDEGVLKAALQSLIKNEAVEVNATVDVTYPEDTKIRPTEKISVDPIVKSADAGADADTEEVDEEGAPQSLTVEGLDFAMGEVAEGYEAEVNDEGVVSVTAPSGVEVGSTAEFTVLVNEQAVPLTVAVEAVSADSDDSDESEGSESPGEYPAEENPLVAPTNSISLDKETYEELKAAAQFGWEAMENKKKSDQASEVDTWITEGRISAGLRDKAIKAMETSPSIARDLYGSNPVNTIPRASAGYTKADNDQSSDKISTLLAKAASMKSNK